MPGEKNMQKKKKNQNETNEIKERQQSGKWREIKSTRAGSMTDSKTTDKSCLKKKKKGCPIMEKREKEMM